MPKLIKLNDNDGPVFIEPYYDIITAFQTARPVLNVATWGSATIPLNGQIVVGNKLTRVGNNVVIGAGVSRVKISANVSVWQIDNRSTVEFFIRRNTAVASASELYILNSGTNQMGLSISPRIINVSEGDTISLAVSLASFTGDFTILGDTSRTFLTVEAVEYN